MSEHLVITLLKYLVGIVIPLVIPVVVRFFLVKRRVSTLWTVVIVVTNFILMFAVVNIGSGRPPSFLEAFLYLLVPMAILKGQYGKKDAHSEEEQASRKKRAELWAGSSNKTSTDARQKVSCPHCNKSFETAT